LIDDIIYLKKAVRLGTQSQDLDISKLNRIINSLQTKALRYDILEDKYLNQNAKHFEESCMMYFSYELYNDEDA